MMSGRTSKVSYSMAINLRSRNGGGSLASAVVSLVMAGSLALPVDDEPSIRRQPIEHVDAGMLHCLTL
jgi:hypothetical protein